MTAGIIEDSRLDGGTLTLGGLAFAKQMTSVQLTPSVDTQGDDVETLSGATISADEVTTWELELGAIQDFDDPTGFVEYCRAHAGEEEAFTWEPNAVDAPTYAGTVKIRAVAIGGDVKTRLKTDGKFPVVGDITPTYPV